MAKRSRNNEIQRIETFSDGVFAFAVTLLIVSLEVPKSFEELMVMMRGFYAFGISFLLLVFIWNEQHIFFRQYGLQDTLTLSLNLALLFIVLFYVYPLKFLFTLLFSDQIYGPSSPLKISQEQAPVLMQIYAVGYIAIYTLFLLMYLRAYYKMIDLDMTPIEKFRCKTSILKQVVMIMVGCISLLAARIVSANHLWISGFSYMLIGPALMILFSIRGRQLRLRFPQVKK